jgi:hypothetical protein
MEGFLKGLSETAINLGTTDLWVKISIPSLLNINQGF